MDIYSGYGLACLPACSTSATSTIHKLTKCLVHSHDTLDSIASDQENHLIVSEVWRLAHTHGIHWTRNVSIIESRIE